MWITGWTLGEHNSCWVGSDGCFYLIFDPKTSLFFSITSSFWNIGSPIAQYWPTGSCTHVSSHWLNCDYARLSFSNWQWNAQIHKPCRDCRTLDSCDSAGNPLKQEQKEKQKYIHMKNIVTETFGKATKQNRQNKSFWINDSCKCCAHIGRSNQEAGAWGVSGGSIKDGSYSVL